VQAEIACVARLTNIGASIPPSKASSFKSLKAELVWRRNWQTRREVEVALFEYINGFYNPRRKHSALSWKSPVAFEQKAA
jgi:transposase InsO family protein